MDIDDEQKMIGLDYSSASWDVLDIILDDPPEPSVYDEMAKANTKRPDILRLMMDHANTPEDVREFIRKTLNLPALAERVVKTEERKFENLTMKIQKMGVSQRVQLALKGGREARGILARDANKQVSLAVLDNGKITESEIELIVKNRSTLEDSLRKITKNRLWMKNYSILIGIIQNPKTPPGLCVGFVTQLKVKDLIVLEQNKNVSEIIRTAAKKVLAVRKPK